jgi:hypothetical protein
VLVSVGDAVVEGAPLAVIDARAVASADQAPDPDRAAAPAPGPGPVTAAGRRADDPRADLAAVRERHPLGLDAARPDAVAKRHDRGRRTARENLEDLLGPGSFVECRPLMFAAQDGGVRLRS